MANKYNTIKYYRQITTTAMGTPMPPNYAIHGQFRVGLNAQLFSKNWIIGLGIVSFYWQYFLHMDR